MEDASTVVGVHHIGLAVSDLDRSIDFYRAATGLAVSDQRVVDAAPWRHLSTLDAPVASATIVGPNATIELTEVATADDVPVVPVEGPGVTHLCFQSPAEASLYAAFVDAGAHEVSRNAPVDLGGYGVRYGYARDHDGIMFEVEQLDAPPFHHAVWVAHVALVSHDIDRLADFYRRLLGVEPYRRANKVAGPRIDEVTGLDNAHVRAAWFHAGNMVLELWQYVSPATPEADGRRPFDAAGVHRFVFEVGDVEHERTRVEGLGASLLGEIGDRADGGREAYAADPDGNVFGLVEYPRGADASIERLDRITWM